VGCSEDGFWIGWEGLRYDDLLDDMYDLDIKEALSRLPQQEVDLRNQRLK
jgi:ubiquinol-cytochrome c reductase subunit 7